MSEQWKDIAGFEGKYAVNQNGEILFRETGRRTRGSVDKLSGYLKVYLSGKTFLVHRLVAQAFIPNTKNLPQIHHIDGDKQNNCVNNLEWVSQKTHGEKMTSEQKARFRETYQKNLEKRKNLKKVIVC